MCVVEKLFNYLLQKISREIRIIRDAFRPISCKNLFQQGVEATRSEVTRSFVAEIAADCARVMSAVAKGIADPVEQSNGDDLAESPADCKSALQKRCKVLVFVLA